MRTDDFSAPVINFEDLRVGFLSDSNREAHGRRHNLFRVVDAGRSRPASDDCPEADNASCSARRSSSERSSYSSSATRSRTVPSRKVVGSSSTMRAFSTRPRRGLMCPLSELLVQFCLDRVVTSVIPSAWHDGWFQFGKALLGYSVSPSPGKF
jgi:hypothetical protein